MKYCGYAEMIDYTNQGYVITNFRIYRLIADEAYEKSCYVSSTPSGKGDGQRHSKICPKVSP